MWNGFTVSVLIFVTLKVRQILPVCNNTKVIFVFPLYFYFSFFLSLFFSFPEILGQLLKRSLANV